MAERKESLAKRILSPRNRVRGAAVLLLGSLVLWPITQITVASDEPTFTLALSWFAITLTSLDILATTDVRDSNEDDE